MAERGEYRAIRRALIDGKDFQLLKERARSVFVFLKINLGPTGIEVWYPEALVHLISGQTGMPPKAVREALAEVESAHGAAWLRREGNVIWIVDQLRFEPNMKSADLKHRTAIVRHLNGLPRLPIVRDFVLHYPEWFVDIDHTDPRYRSPVASLFEGLSLPLTRAFEGPSKGLRSTDNREPKTEDRGPIKQTPLGPLASAVTGFCERTGSAWKISTPIVEWCSTLLAEPTYAGVDLRYEVTRCTEWHESKKRQPKAPDRAIRNWLEKAAEDAGKRLHAEPADEDEAFLDKLQKELI